MATGDFRMFSDPETLLKVLEAQYGKSIFQNFTMTYAAQPRGESMPKPKTIEFEGKHWYKLRNNQNLKAGDRWSPRSCPESLEEIPEHYTRIEVSVGYLLGDWDGVGIDDLVWRLCDPQPDLPKKADPKSGEFDEGTAAAQKQPAAPTQPELSSLKDLLKQAITVIAGQSARITALEARIKTLEDKPVQTIINYPPPGGPWSPQFPSIPHWPNPTRPEITYYCGDTKHQTPNT